MSAIFVDASFWIAFRGDNEPEHARALELVRKLHSERATLLTTYMVFAEIHAYFSRIIPLRDQVIRDFREAPETRLINPDLADHVAAFSLLREYGDKTFSFCDAVSFVVMRRLSLRRALSFDHHFRQIGEFEILS
jgi:uncharacterized protein